MPLRKLLQALVTSSACARLPSSACTMWAVAGSTTSRVAEANSSRSMSLGSSSAAASAWRAARTARVGGVLAVAGHASRFDAGRRLDEIAR